MYPLVSILWINYNSSKFINIALKSLQSIVELDYPRFEVIIVDNASIDGSFNIIMNFVKEKLKLKTKIIRLRKNIGFTGGNNIAFKSRDRASKYVILLNNDAIPYPESLKTLVEAMEQNPRLGAAQGIVLDYKYSHIDTAGGFIDEVLNSYPLFRGFKPNYIKRPMYVTYTDGSYSIYKVKAIKRCIGGKLFIDEFFAYADDNVLCLQLWNCGYTIRSFPYVVARHKRRSTFRGFTILEAYLTIRNSVALKEITNSRFNFLVDVFISRTAFSHIYQGLNLHKIKVARMVSRAYSDGVKLGKKLKTKGFAIDIYKAPIAKFSPSGIILRRYVTKRISENILSKYSSIMQ